MPTLFLPVPPRKISEPSSTPVASHTPVDPRTGPSLNISSPLPPANVSVVNPNTRIPPVPTPNTGITAPTSVLSLSPLFVDGNPHGEAVTLPTLPRPSPSSNRRRGPPRIVACGMYLFSHFSCHCEHPN